MGGTASRAHGACSSKRGAAPSRARRRGAAATGSAHRYRSRDVDRRRDGCIAERHGLASRLRCGDARREAAPFQLGRNGTANLHEQNAMRIGKSEGTSCSLAGFAGVDTWYSNIGQPESENLTVKATAAILERVVSVSTFAARGCMRLSGPRIPPRHTSGVGRARFQRLEQA